VSINFSNNYHFNNLPFGNVSSAKFAMKQYDPYEIKLEQGPRYTDHVRVAVPYIDSECVFIVDMGVKGNPEKLFSCRTMGMHVRVHLDHGHIVTYHAFHNYSTPVEIVLSDMNNNDLHNLANDVRLGDGISSSLPTGMYRVKVVPENTVSKPREFRKARSLLPDFTIQVEGGAHYYLVLSGIFGSKEHQLRYIMYENVEFKSTEPHASTYTKTSTAFQSNDANADDHLRAHGRSNGVRWVSVSTLVPLVTAAVAALLK
jgi:hypothetical protein